MRGKKLVVFLTLLIFTSAAFNLPSLYAPPTTATALEPQAGFAPPSSQVGDGYPMNLTDSVNDNRTVNLKANNTRAATTYRNATLSGEQLTGFTKVWQNLTLTQLQATYDARAVQGGSSSAEYLRARNQTADNKKLAMRFTTMDKANLTGIWMYYSLGGSSISFTINVTATDSKTPSGSSGIGGGSLSTTGGVEGWYYVPLSSPVTLTRGNYYWLIADASALSPGSFDWYYIRDQGGVEDGIYGSAYRTAVGWLDETQMVSLSLVPAYFNLMLVLKVIPVDDSLNIRQYSSPQQVNMYLNSTGNPITANSSRISNVFNTFVLCTNTSVTFTARWDARFEKTQTGVATTNFIAENGLTFWNVTFASGDVPANLHTLYNRTLRVFTVPGYWAIQSSNVSNTGTVISFAASFTPGSGYVFIVQGGNPDADPWVDTWLVEAKSTYKITATLPSQVVEGLPLTVDVSTGVYSGSWCNVTFYDATNPVYTKNASIPSNSYALTIKLNSSGLHTLFLFDRWMGGNEATLNSTMTVTVLPPLCNVSVISTNEPLPGNTASIRFQFHNNSKGGEHMSPDSVRINGTSTSFTYSSEVVTANWSTATGGWRVGLNYVNVSATNGVFSNATIATLTILEPLCNVTVVYRFSPVLGNIAELGFKFYNNSLGTGNTWIQPEAVSANGTLISFAYDGLGGVSSIWLSTASGTWHAGNNTLVVSAKAGIFNASLNTWILVLEPACNITVTGRVSPVINSTGTLRFKFYNNSLGTGNTVIQPAEVSVNGTPTSNFGYDVPSGVTSLYMNTASGGWHVGNNTIVVSAKNGVFNATLNTWILVLEPACNITMVDRNSPVPGSSALLKFRFYNNSLGSGIAMQPEGLSVNGTLLTSFAYDGPSGVTSVWLSTASGGWHVGNNTLVISAMSGVFNTTKQTWILVQVPLCNVTVDSVNNPIFGNPASIQFRFLNNTASGAAMPPIKVTINGTDTPFNYASGVTTVTWSTLTGGWLPGTHYVRVYAESGVFLNFTVVQIIINPPNAVLTLNATSYSATYGDNIPIGFTFLNLTGGSPHPFPSQPMLYLNDSLVSFTPVGGNGYVYVLSTQYFTQAGAYHLNFTARYGTYVATNITTVAVSKISMTLILSLGQTSVTAGSDLGVSANLTYSNGAPIADGTEILFTFDVTYANSTVKMFSTTALTVDGIASPSFTTTSEMKEISVRAFYAGDGTKASANDEELSIPVTPPTAGFPVIVVAGVAGIAVFAALIPIALRARRKKGREEEHRKTAVLRQTASLAQLVVVDLRSGRCVFSRSLGSEENVDPHLISGFLSANQSLLAEVFKNKSKAGLRFADYGDYKVISHVGNYIMATLFATETAGEELKGVLEKFTDRFEKTYGKSLESWDGDTCAFEDAEEITDEVFALQLTSPYMLLDVPSAKLNKNERAATHFARILSAERGVFFMPRVVDYLLTKQGLKRGQAMDAINSLTKKGIIRQLTIEQAAQVVKSTLEKSGDKA